jgi:hypothetical protein
MGNKQDRKKGDCKMYQESQIEHDKRIMQEQKKQGDRITFSLILIACFVGGLMGCLTVENSFFVGLLYSVLCSVGALLVIGIVWIGCRFVAEQMEGSKNGAKALVCFVVLVVAYLIGRNLLGEMIQ